jgi:16S rRNA G966 N2-methylase RsmD
LRGNSPVNQLYYGDNLEVLRRHIGDESVALIDLDPPFNSNASDNVLAAPPSCRPNGWAGGGSASISPAWPSASSEAEWRTHSAVG